MKDAEEKVLVIPRGLLETQGMFQGLTFDIDRYLPVLRDNRNYRFIPRSAAENDPTLKQLIPYFIICHQSGIWAYTRGKKSGETRLVARISIGIGGHINNLDENLFEDIYQRAATRELEEEVAVPPGYTQKIVALLNDDATPVGSVHLGVVHVLRTSSPAVSKRESAITEAGFRTRAELEPLRQQMETWSQICFDHIEEVLARGP